MATPVSSAATNSLPTLLKQVFGHVEFRPLQREIMEATLAGRDAVAILPTGAGKSLCYQLPALARDGLTVVVSPLIALMKDQVDQLHTAGVAATFLNSSLDNETAYRRTRRLDEGGYKLLYVAPERLVTSEFLTRLVSWRVA
ncbi:MAG: DEAD/DEAH box helicase, partial [Planctomycetia bacterium]